MAAFGFMVLQPPTPRSNQQQSTVWEVSEQEVNDDDNNDGEDNEAADDEEEDYEPAPPRSRTRRRDPSIEDAIPENEGETWNTPEASGDRRLFITQQDPEPYQEAGTLTIAQKCKGPEVKTNPSISRPMDRNSLIN